ncbi:MAG: O-methyltransferase [Candidatus Eiseniibacteriota bacterium]|jgi:predicted O-methyltransferase YrrM
MNGIVAPHLDDYLLAHAPRRDRVLRDMEALAEREGIPIVGPAVGALLELLARSHGARRVFELGSAIGYSTIWWARAVGPRGRVYYTDADPHNAERATRFLRRARVADRVEVLVGDALESLRRTRGTFDVIFNDVDKWEYPSVLRQAVPRLKRGGLLVTDNALWYGKVATEADDADTRGVRLYNRRAARSRQLLTTILPLRDGVSVAMRVDDA